MTSTESRDLPRAHPRASPRASARCWPAAIRRRACRPAPTGSAGDLLWHLARVQWFWSSIVLDRPAEKDEADEPERPAAYAEVLAAFDEWSAALIGALDGVDVKEEAWTWSTEQTVGFIVPAAGARGADPPARRRADRGRRHRGRRQPRGRRRRRDARRDVRRLSAVGHVGAAPATTHGSTAPTPATSSGPSSGSSAAPTPTAAT